MIPKNKEQRTENRTLYFVLCSLLFVRALVLDITAVGMLSTRPCGTVRRRWSTAGSAGAVRLSCANRRQIQSNWERCRVALVGLVDCKQQQVFVDVVPAVQHI